MTYYLNIELQHLKLSASFILLSHIFHVDLTISSEGKKSAIDFQNLLMVKINHEMAIVTATSFQ